MKKIIVALTAFAAFATIPMVAFATTPASRDGTNSQAILAAQTDIHRTLTFETLLEDQTKSLIMSQVIIAASSKVRIAMMTSRADTLFQTMVPNAMAAITVRGVMTLSDFESSSVRSFALFAFTAQDGETNNRGVSHIRVWQIVSLTQSEFGMVEDAVG